MAKNRQIQYLPKGWVWSNDPWSYTTGKGATKISNARHGHGPRGQNISLRAVQDRQKQAQAKQGIQRPAPVRRAGKIRTFKGYPGAPQSIFSAALHGSAQSFSFYTLESMQSYVALHGLDTKYLNVTIQIKYTEKITDTSKTGSPTAKGKKNGYATLTPFRTAGTFNKTASSTQTTFGELKNPWIQAQENLGDYDMSGAGARFYIYMAER
jgi:hypothetical protein